MTTRRSLLFLGGKEIGAACFQHLLESRERLNYQVVGTLTSRRTLFNSERTVSAMCAEAGIPIIDSLDALAAGPEVDLIVSVQYHEILKPVHIAKARQIAVNLHMAPLPEYRGCNQFSFAILDQVREFGTTLHRLEAGIDSGDIIAERRFPIADDITVGELYRRTYQESVTLFAATLPQLIANEYTLRPQHSYRGTRKSSLHFRKEIDALKQIDLSAPADEICRRIRATAMPGFPPPYALIGRHRIEFQLRDP